MATMVRTSINPAAGRPVSTKARRRARSTALKVLISASKDRTLPASGA